MSFTCKELKITLKDKILLDISFTCEGSLALIGQSGSGKSLTLKAILGLNQSLLKTTFDYEANFELQNGKSVSFVPQNPFTALSPMTKIGDQVLYNEEIFGFLDLDREFLQRYPSELSGGQLQRLIIAIALSNRPKLLLMDEPTTALDSKNTKMVLNMLGELKKKYSFLLLYVTHDIDSAYDLCEDVAILKDGVIVEQGSMQEVRLHPKHSYTKELFEASFKNRGFRQ